MPDYMKIPGLISPDERLLFKGVAEDATAQFNSTITIVNIGVFMGASCGNFRTGAPNAILYGVDINGWEWLEDPQIPEGTIEFLNMSLLQGDSRELWKDFHVPVHVMFIDDTHNYEFVSAHIQTWVKNVVPGGYVLFHDAWFPEESVNYKMGADVSRAIDEFLLGWEEQERVDSVRWFKKL